jgi:hypothetical protein
MRYAPLVNSTVLTRAVISTVKTARSIALILWEHQSIPGALDHGKTVTR